MQQKLRRWNQYPYMTIGLIIINFIVFGLMTISGGTENTQNLLKFGAIFKPLVLQNGEWWRLISAMFIHIGITHIVLNMVTLYFIGLQIEKLFGHFRFLIIYFVAGIFGNLVSLLFGNPLALSAGASGAIFGLFGVWLMLGESFRQNPYIRSMARQLGLFVILALVSSLMESGIDVYAHVGGILAGFLVGYLVGVPKIGKVDTAKRIIASVTLVALFGVAIWILLTQ
ncbi:rhomboid family intramembrane serine protease [Pediococcus damnosus]|uniref:rhomboid family intramembrane serine protease n=1 Tax=Pediococcus damnosus TaxID=51663 RepID=UPI0006200413|nr:rhomboid family intramembrane serine protease [Pediococcus damnosus]AMV70084.1 GlpG protein (membrane protein of glp regulon) [Pediococcus damnosus]KJU74164.1 membrane protein [Pediococcus damnosus LMG 28219]KRN52866.1 membrane-associated serine protease [Pediococcus damnosus]PIO81768.1 rhomboid family intramembrane serine protease [Pediococcus damnosus]PIO84676.1 rhomboid family intramembrane serine protease [Pediococcus damnosus]